MKERRRTGTKRFTHEFAERQSERLEELWRMSDEEYEKMRKSRMEDGQQQQATGTPIP